MSSTFFPGGAKLLIGRGYKATAQTREHVGTGETEYNTALPHKFVEKNRFQICGYSVETSLKESGQDVAALYSDYFGSDKAAKTNSVADSETPGFYGLMRYPEGHERYRYLLGKKAVNLKGIPEDAEIKDLR